MQAIGSLLLQWGCVDQDFVERHTVGFQEWAEHLQALDWAAVERATEPASGRARYVGSAADLVDFLEPLLAEADGVRLQPASLAVELADREGLTLAAFSRGSSINVYTHPDRVGPPLRSVVPATAAARTRSNP